MADMHVRKPAVIITCPDHFGMSRSRSTETKPEIFVKKILYLQ